MFDFCYLSHQLAEQIHLHRRATAYISKTLEALPIISISIPIAFGLLSKPDLLQFIFKTSSVANVPLLVAGLNDSILL